MSPQEQVTASVFADFTRQMGREPDTHELIFALADAVLETAKLVSPGYARWLPGYPTMPAKRRVEAVGVAEFEGRQYEQE